MRFPVDTSKLSVTVIGEALPVVDFATNEPRKSATGLLLYKIPVLISGTGDRQDPTTTITVAGERPTFASGVRLTIQDLQANTWTIKGNDGQVRSGVTLSAKSVSGTGSKAS